jgi:NADPH:quinone reductase-like Zn-dependent oxidoreductase
MKRGGVIATVSGIPASDDMARMLLKPPFFARWGMDALDSLNRWRCSQSKLQYSWVLGEPSQTQMERLTCFAEEGKLKAVVAETIPLADLEAIKRAALRIKAQKGGLPGKTVIVVCADEP